MMACCQKVNYYVYPQHLTERIRKHGQRFHQLQHLEYAFTTMMNKLIYGKNFHGSEKVTVYFFKTENRSFAEYQWSYLDSQHSRGYASVRCMIPGKTKAFIKCPDTVSCTTCPYKDKKQAPIISWDGLVETGYEPVGSAPVDEQVAAKLEYEGTVTPSTPLAPLFA